MAAGSIGPRARLWTSFNEFSKKRNSINHREHREHREEFVELELPLCSLCSLWFQFFLPERRACPQAWHALWLSFLCVLGHGYFLPALRIWSYMAPSSKCSFCALLQPPNTSSMVNVLTFGKSLPYLASSAGERG